MLACNFRYHRLFIFGSGRDQAVWAYRLRPGVLDMCGRREVGEGEGWALLKLTDKKVDYFKYYRLSYLPIPGLARLKSESNRRC